MKLWLAALLLSSCIFGSGARYDELDKKYQIWDYFENHRQAPDRKLPPYIFIILEKIKKEKYEEVDERFQKGFEIFPDQQHLYVEHVKYFYGKGDYDEALKRATRYSEMFPKQVELKILRDGLQDITSGKEQAKEQLAQNLKDFSSMSRKFTRDKIKNATRGK